MKRKKKRYLSMFIAICMLLTMISQDVMASAAGGMNDSSLLEKTTTEDVDTKKMTTENSEKISSEENSNLEEQNTEEKSVEEKTTEEQTKVEQTTEEQSTDTKISELQTILNSDYSEAESNGSLIASTYTDLWNQEKNAYLISNVNDLKIFRNSLSEHDYKDEKVLLTKNIKIYPADDIGSVLNTTFNGYFNGQGYTIAGFCDNTCGLFYIIGENAVVTKLNLNVNVELTGKTKCNVNGDYAPFSYLIQGKVAYCTTSGSINASSETDDFNIEGFSSWICTDLSDSESLSKVKLNYPAYSVNNCCSKVDINILKANDSGFSYVTGFAQNYALKKKSVVCVYNIYVNSKIVFLNNTKGIVNNVFTMEKDWFCLAGTLFCNLKIESDNSETHNLNDEFSINCTDEQMKTLSTFTNAGWDFNKVWNMDTEGYYDKIFITDATDAPEGVQTYLDDETGGTYYYDTELKFVNNGYPYIRSDVLEPAFGNAVQKAVYVKAEYPDVKIGYYSPAKILPKITITGIEGVDNADLKSFIDKYEISYKCNDINKILLYEENESIGSIDSLKTSGKLSYKSNVEYQFYVDYDNSSVTSGTAKAVKNPSTATTAEKADAYLELTMNKSVSDFTSTLSKIESGDITNNVIKASLCWDVITILRYDKNDGKLDDILDKWFEMEKAAFKEMYTENKNMTQELTTTWQRELIAITAAGYDPYDIKEYTKGTYGADDEGFDLVKAVADEVGGEGAHMHIPFWLIGLDSGDYATSDNYDTDVDNRVNKVYSLIKMKVFGGGKSIAMDYIAMYTQGLAKYINPEKGTIYYDVAQKVNQKLADEGAGYTIAEKADKTAQIAAIREYQCPLGGWITYDNYNPCTTAQAIIMLSIMGIDAFGKDVTTDAGYSMLDSLIFSGFNLNEKYLPVSLKTNSEMQQNLSFYSVQSVYACVSRYRLINKQTALYDCTDVVGVPQVEKMIAALPANITLSDEAAVNKAKAAYDNLTKGQKKYVDNYSVLKSAAAVIETALAKEKYAELKGGKSSLDAALKEAVKTENLSEFSKKLAELLDVMDCLSMEEQNEISAVKNSIASINHVDDKSGIKVDGVDWNIKATVDDLSIADIEDIKTDLKNNTNYGEETVIYAIDLSLKDIITGSSYEPGEGEAVTVTIAVPESAKNYDHIIIVHKKADGTFEYITPVINGDGTMTFTMSSFSPIAIVGVNDKVSEDLISDKDTIVRNLTTSGQSTGTVIAATGDKSQMDMYMALCIFALSGAALAGIGIYSNKKRQVK